MTNGLELALEKLRKHRERQREIALAKKKREKERERKKEKKLRERAKAKKKRHEKTLRRRRAYMRKYYRDKYRERSKVKWAERKKNGDEYGYFSIFVTKNHRKHMCLGRHRWKSEAYLRYTEALEENRKTVAYPVNARTRVYATTRRRNEMKYEILLVKHINDGESTVASFRDKDGKFVESIIVDDDKHVILDKDIWYVEETFNIYGHHPVKDRKEYRYILNEMLLNTEDTGDEMKRIVIYNNKLIVERIDDFDFVICSDNKQCVELYNRLEKDIAPLKRKYTVFMGQVPTEQSAKWIDRLQEKTGWARQSCRRINNLY